MKRLSKFISVIMLIIVVVLAIGCKKTDNPNNSGDEGGDTIPTMPLEEGMYFGILGFNEVLTEKQITLLNTSTKSSFITFINGLNMADGTALYYADYKALSELQSFPEPSALKKVALVTFTDGLDNLSTSSSIMNPENYGSVSDYRAALHNKILNDRVHGKPITAYTIGLRGNDVQNNLSEFRANLNMLASDANNVYEVTDMSEALERFRAIAEDLYYSVTTINLKMKLPGGIDDGLMLRFTFDDVSDAESSQEYIECIYKRTSNNGRRLESISYSGFMPGVYAMDAISQTETGTFHWFEFEGLTHSNGDVISSYDINHIQLWKKQESVWQRDSEFTPGSSTEVTETKSSAMIMLVLDCTSSLGGDFSLMKTGAIRFVESLCSGGGEQGFTVSVSANPTDGGTVRGGGIFQHGQSCTVSAEASTGYTFNNWTENGTEVYSNPDYNFTVVGSRALIAQFQIQNYTIATSVSPTDGGTVTGGGNFNYGQSCTVTATANDGYSFKNWTENGSVVSNDINYSFTVNGNRDLVAIFVTAPMGAINGLFSVSETQKVWFSQGNLQYIGSADTPYWKFAENQWDCLGDNGQGSDNQLVDRDLFGWGTSGWNCGNTYYHPWDVDNSDGSLYGTPGNYNLVGSYANSDWGCYNVISNGGTQTVRWRTLTGGADGEWKYVFHKRVTPSGIRFAKAQIAVSGNRTINGVILLPDDWDSSFYDLKNFNSDVVSFSSNEISSYTWTNILQMHGAVFLPAAGVRSGTYVRSVDSYGNYWSSFAYNEIEYAYTLQFYDNGFWSSCPSARWAGESVRLVCPAD